MKRNIKIDENYYLVSDRINNDTTVDVVSKTNHIFVVDVSGSMYNELPLIRTQLKNKLPSLMKEGDTISIVWFSGNKEAGILKEEVEVKSLKTFSDLNDAIDRWLQPIGLTAFLKPLGLVKDLIERIKKNRPDSAFAMIFLTDGYNNDCSWNEVMSTLKTLENDISSSTFVEYGYYADSQKLTEMSATLGGEKISCNGFDDFEPVFNDKISSGVYGGKKVVIELNDEYLYDFAFSVNNGSVLLYNIVDNKIMVGSDVKEIHYFSSKTISGMNYILNNDSEDDEFTALYAAIYVLSDKLMNDDAERIFYALGDQHYYKMLVNAFGKQNLNTFKTAIKECVVDVTKRFPASGRVEIQPVSDDAYCLMNLIEDLGKIEGCEFYPNHEEFVYNRIGRKKINVATILTDNEKKRLAEAKNITEVMAITNEINDNKVDVKFIDSNPNKGYSLTDLVWNESRANLSVRIYIEGEAILPENEFKIDKVASFKYRTFTLIKDGIVNVEKLPVNYSPELVNILVDNNIKWEKYSVKGDYDNTIIIDLTSIPLINRGMVKGISAMELAKREWELIKLQGDKKVYDYYKKSLFPRTSKSFVDLFGQEEADWLKEIGITDFNGFNPKVVSAESTDFYISVNLDTKIKGLSSLPKVDDVLSKIRDNKKLTLREWVMSGAIKKYLSQLDSDMYKSLSEEQQKGVLKTYLETKSEILNKQRRKLLQEIAEIKFALILSKKWFTEFKTFDENQLSVNFDGQDLDFTFVLDEKEEKI